METDLAPIKAALAGMTDAELDALAGTTYKAPQTAPGLLAWLDSACTWQVFHRAGRDYELQPPEAAIPDEEDSVSIDAAQALRLAVANDSRSVHAFFDALVALHTGEGRRR